MYVLDSCELVSLACVLFIRSLVVEFPMILSLTASGIHSDLSSLYVCIWYATIHWSTINTWAMRFFFAFMLQEFDSIFKERFSIERTLIVDDYILKPRWESSKFNIFDLHSHFESLSWKSSKRMMLMTMMMVRVSMVSYRKSYNRIICASLCF